MHQATGDTPQRTVPHRTSAETLMTFPNAAVLDIMRCFFASNCPKTTHAWETAFELSNKVFSRPGATHTGDIVAGAVLRAVQSMRRARRNTFRFSNPFCPRCRTKLTEHERHLLTVYDSIDRDKVTARTHATILCEGENCEEFLASVSELKTMIADVSVR